MKTKIFSLLGLFFVLAAFAAPTVQAEQTPSFHIAIKSGHFDPAQLTIPAGKKIKLLVSNDTALPAEFESYDFTVEKVIPGHTRIPVYVGPLKAGNYRFFNDFSQNITGKLIVK